MLIRAAQVNGKQHTDIRLGQGRVLEIAGHLERNPQERVIDAHGGALFPGLHDHHIHLTALAVAMTSVDCGPPHVVNRETFRSALERATVDQNGWLRGIGYHDSVAGRLEKNDIDEIISDVPVRIQHRSGRLWIMNALAVQMLAAHSEFRPAEFQDFLETGRLQDDDSCLKRVTGSGAPPPLADVANLLLSYGVTGITDTTPDNGPDDYLRFKNAQSSGELPLKVRMMGRADLQDAEGEKYLSIGERKIHLSDSALPDLEDFTRWIIDAHAMDRNVAIHCVTQAELLLSLAALQDAGVRSGDRIEHGSVIVPELIPDLAERGLCVVTQPNFIGERGDVYRKEIEPALHDQLYRVRTLIDSDIAVGFGTDAPFGNPNPWRSMQSAIDRQTVSGYVLGQDEAISPEQALAGFLTPLDAPGAEPRSITVGMPADLVLLNDSWEVLRQSPAKTAVRATLIDGAVVYESAGLSVNKLVNQT